MKISEFIQQNQITIESTKVPRTPYSGDFDAEATHWSCTLRRRGGYLLDTWYSMGSAHKGKPKIEDVLDCLASDASGYTDARNFEGWADGYGYDRDSRKAERLYNQIGENAQKLKDFLGNGLYAQLLNDVERL